MTITVQIPMSLPSVANGWTEAEISTLRETYACSPLKLDALAKTLGRDKANICRKARSLGLTNQRRSKTIARKPKQATFFVVPEFRAAVTSFRIKEHIKTSGHARGMLGKKHTAETLARVAQASRAQWANPNSKQNSAANAQRRSDEMVRNIKAGKMRSGYTRGKGGKRADIGDRYFRSSWEANYARLLNFRMKHGDVVAWDFECQTFEFVGIKRGSRLYVPDFKVTFADGRHEWHEVKGWMDARSKTKLRRMAKYHPNEKVVVIGADSFKAFRRQGFDRMIPNWERG